MENGDCAFCHSRQSQDVFSLATQGPTSHWSLRGHKASLGWARVGALTSSGAPGIPKERVEPITFNLKTVQARPVLPEAGSASHTGCMPGATCPIPF